MAARRLDPDARQTWRRAHAIPDADLVAVCAARIEPWKDQATLLDAVGVAHRAGVRVALACVGAVNPGAAPYAASLRRRAAELGIDAQVVWAGYQADVAAWLKYTGLPLKSFQHLYLSASLAATAIMVSMG